MMIRFALKDCEGTIKLLNEDKPHHLVAESHRRERHLGVGAVVNLLSEAVGATNDENQSFRA